MNQSTARVVRKSLSSVDLLDMSFDLPEERQLSPPHTMTKQMIETSSPKIELVGEFHGYLPWVPSLKRIGQNLCDQKEFSNAARLNGKDGTSTKQKNRQLVANSSLHQVLQSEESKQICPLIFGDGPTVNPCLSPKSYKLNAEVSGGNCCLPDSSSTDFSSQSQSPGRFIHRNKSEKLQQSGAQSSKFTIAGIGSPQLQTPYKLSQTKSENTQLSTGSNFRKQPLQIVNLPADTRESLPGSPPRPLMLRSPKNADMSNHWAAKGMFGSVSSPKYQLESAKQKNTAFVVTGSEAVVEPQNKMKVIDMNEELAQLASKKFLQSKLKVKSNNSDNKLGVPESIFRDIQTKRSKFYSVYKKLPIKRVGFRPLLPEPSTDTQQAKEQLLDGARKVSHVLQLPEIRPIKPALPSNVFQQQNPALDENIPKLLTGTSSSRDLVTANKLLQSRRSQPALTATQKAREEYSGQQAPEKPRFASHFEAKPRFGARGLLGTLHRDEIEKLGL